MCTVIFIPGKENIFLGSLRDESPKRPKASAPEKYTSGNISYIAPKDAMANGTWIGVNSAGDAIVLLNGGFQKHEKRNSYRKSRGLIVTELLASAMPVALWSLSDMEDIEPFTLIVWSDSNLFELVWDGNKKNKTKLDEAQPYIWSSSTLYNAKAKAKRSELFYQWIARNWEVSKPSILNFFSSFSDTQNGFIINRNEETKTLCYSFIELYPDDRAILNYYDFAINPYSIKTIPLQPKPENSILPVNGETIFSKN